MSAPIAPIGSPPGPKSAAPVQRAPSADLNLRVFAPLARFLRAHHGLSGLEQTASLAGLAPSDLDGTNRWASFEQVETFLSAVRALVPDDETFKVACAYELREALGPLRFLLWATSPIAVQIMAIRNIESVSRISKFEVLSSSPTSVEQRYSSTRRESRLMCLVRHAQGAAMPTMWGLPPGQLREGKCIGRGDDVCEYHWRFYRARRWTPVLLGFAGGGALATAAAMLSAPPLVGIVLLPVAGALLGVLVDQHRRLRANLQVGEEILAGQREAAAESAEARHELVELQQRERQWSRLVEEQLGERTALLQQVVATVEGAQRKRVSAIRGFSHDLRNPLTVLKHTTAYLRSQPSLDDPTVVEDQALAVEQLDALTRMLLAAAHEAPIVQLAPVSIPVTPMVDRLRRRLAAIAYGTGLRTMVFPTRDAPDAIETDPVVFDRVVDNLLTNAVKYTERGSIAVEIGGTPGHLTIKVSDTGRGIEPSQIQRIFEPGGSGKAQRAPGSHGLGLSVVVSLLHQIGGRLEVMSKLESGTTFWAHFPVALRSPTPVGDENGANVVNKVVRIRQASGA